MGCGLLTEAAHCQGVTFGEVQQQGGLMRVRGGGRQPHFLATDSDTRDLDNASDEGDQENWDGVEDTDR